MRYICIHGHFYQPPRENPWLEAIEVQDTAFPAHDWNERILNECYAPNASARLLTETGAIRGIINNYEYISFNLGPTLLSWMKSAAPHTYRAVIEADRRSRKRFGGHGNALAQAYNHTILPLATHEEKIVQVQWGIADFRHNFGREPEGMWLPECAADSESLNVLAEHGIRFVVLAPHQAALVRSGEHAAWVDCGTKGVDPTRAYRINLAGGRSIAAFFYDGPISRAVAFEGLLSSGDRFYERLLQGFSDRRDHPQLMHIATDGESYGHHHRYGDMALAAVLNHAEQDETVTLTNYAQYLDLHPPTWEARIVEPSSWSCAHGVERWRSNCGCSTGSQPSQQWRGPLRQGLNALRDRVEEIFQRAGALLFKDATEARRAYISVILDRSAENVARFLREHLKTDAAEHVPESEPRVPATVPPPAGASTTSRRKRPSERHPTRPASRRMGAIRHSSTTLTASAPEPSHPPPPAAASSSGSSSGSSSEARAPALRVRSLELLELARNAQLMFTSCGWFFDEISGLEPVQVLKYAARAIQLGGRFTDGAALESALLDALADAPSNLATVGSGRDLYEDEVRPTIADRARVFAHFGVTAMFQQQPVAQRLYCYEIEMMDFERWDYGSNGLAVGRLRVNSIITTSLREAILGILHFGNHDIYCAVQEVDADKEEEPEYERIKERLLAAFHDQSLATVVREMDAVFHGGTHSLADLFLDDRRSVLGLASRDNLARFDETYQRLYDDNVKLMEYSRRIKVPVPRAFLIAAEYVLARELDAAINELYLSIIHREDLLEGIRAILAHARQWNILLDGSGLESRVRSLLERHIADLHTRVTGRELTIILDLFDVAQMVPINLNRWSMQNTFFRLLTGHGSVVEAALKDTPRASLREQLRQLAVRLHIDPTLIPPASTI